MKCVVVCQDDLVIKTLHEALAPTFDVTFVVEDRPLSRRLHDAGVPAVGADPRRLSTYVKADVDPTTCVIVHDSGRRGVRRVLRAVTDAGTGLVYVLSVTEPSAEWAEEFPEVARLTLSHLVEGALHDSLDRSLTRARVQQYQRYFSDADRVLILLHNDPDPDALASGLALRNLLHRTKTTAIIGAFRGVTRPENLRMANLLDIQVEALTAESLAEFDRIATVDVQPHYFGGLLNRVDLVVDHHPERSGYTTTFKDIRPDFGSTATILTEHLRSVDVNISERTATAMLYAIKSDTLFLSRHTNRTDLEAFTFLYPLADAALVRKMEGSEITLERLESVSRAVQTGRLEEQVFAAHVGRAAREDLVPYVADFLLQLEGVKWSIVSGIVDAHLVVSVRNLGYSRNAGEFVRRWFNDIGSAGGHRAMAKAVVPLAAFHEKFGPADGPQVSALLADLAARFLRHGSGGDRSP
ncbi:MAG: DHH family phosphoesterase [Acidobacteria bacterium]|nr:DHH family phosphoesterase [Acidobacteriota bacterium]